MSEGNPPPDIQFGAYFYETPECVLGPDCASSLQLVGTMNAGQAVRNLNARGGMTKKNYKRRVPNLGGYYELTSGFLETRGRLDDLAVRRRIKIKQQAEITSLKGSSPKKNTPSISRNVIYRVSFWFRRKLLLTTPQACCSRLGWRVLLVGDVPEGPGDAEDPVQPVSRDKACERERDTLPSMQTQQNGG